MGCCGNRIGDTPGVIPFRRMTRIAPLSPDAPQPQDPVWRSCRWDTIALEAVSRVGRKPSIPPCSSGSTAMPQGSTAGPKLTMLPYRRNGIPIFEILEEQGFEVVLVNSRHIKNVPGRKTDVLDCQWIQELHSVGLLRGSSPSSSTALSRATWTTTTPAPRPTKNNTEPEPCAIGPGNLVLGSSMPRPGSYSMGQLLRRAKRHGAISRFFLRWRLTCCPGFPPVSRVSMALRRVCVE